MSATPNRPLKDSEIEQLGNLLLNLNGGDAMTIEELDGFFCALICGPDLVLPSEYLIHVFRGQADIGEVFESQKEAERFFSLSMRLWNMIAAELGKGEPHRVCIFDEDLDGVPSATRWAVGFLNGMALRHESWDRLVKDKAAGPVLMPIFQLAAEGGAIPGTAPVEIPETILQGLLLGVMAGLPLIYAYFRTSPPIKRTRNPRKSKTKTKKKPNGSGPLVH